MSTPPNPATRDRNADLRVLAIAVVRERLSFSDSVLSAHVADSKDLLVAFVERSIGVTFRVNWSEVKDEELPAIGAWQDYCCDLFDSVKDFTIATLTG